MGCDGCELYPTTAQVRQAFLHAIYPASPAPLAIVDLIDSFTDGGPQAAKLQLKASASIIASAVILRGHELPHRELVRHIVAQVSARYICYASSLHRGFNSRGGNSGYAFPFEVPKLFPGRTGRSAALPAPSEREIADKPWLAGYPRLIFLSDMSDALSRSVPFEFLQQEIIQPVSSPQGQRHYWLWLSKRPGRMAKFSSWLNSQGIAWPDHLIAMTSVTGPENLARVEQLKMVRAKYRGLSVEPLQSEVHLPLSGIDWVIVGGQSGPYSRTFDLGWAETIHRDCQAAGAAFFLKQFGRLPVYRGVDLHLQDSHGGDWSEWEPRFRVRELPKEWKT